MLARINDPNPDSRRRKHRVDVPTRVNNLLDAAREKITWQTV